MKMKYGSPNILEANGTIDLTVSQLAEIGLSDPAAWETWWEESGDIVQEIFPDFDINTPGTWPEGFDPSDPESWDILLNF